MHRWRHPFLALFLLVRSYCPDRRFWAGLTAFLKLAALVRIAHIVLPGRLHSRGLQKPSNTSILHPFGVGLTLGEPQARHDLAIKTPTGLPYLSEACT